MSAIIFLIFIAIILVVCRKESKHTQRKQDKEWDGKITYDETEYNTTVIPMSSPENRAAASLQPDPLSPGQPLPVLRQDEGLPPIPSTAPEKTHMTDSEALLSRYTNSFYAAKPAAALEACISEWIKTSFDRKIMSRDTMKKQLLATGFFELIAFTDLVLMFLYHRSYFLHIVILLLDILFMALSMRRINTARSFASAIAAMPDTDIESILMSATESTVPAIKVTLIKLAGAVVLSAILLISFWNPHMIFENNGTGAGLRFYTASFSGEDHVTIPDTYNGKKVTEIRGNVFQNLSGIKSISLPSGITEIRGNTFEGCSGLESIEIPYGVTRIAGHAFYGCSSLQEVKLPSTLRTIGSSAFRRCGSLYSIQIPSWCIYETNTFKESPTKILH